MPVKIHELIVAAATGAVFGLVGYYLTRKIEGPVERAVSKLGA